MKCKNKENRLPYYRLGKLQMLIGQKNVAL